MKYKLLVLLLTILVVFGFLKFSEPSPNGLLFLWGVLLVLLLFGWGYRLYLLLYYKREKAEFVRWVPLRVGAKRLYPEYGFEAGGSRCLLINRHHMKGDEPWEMAVWHHPTKPQRAFFFTLRVFVFLPLFEAISFGCITSIWLSQQRFGVLSEKLTTLF